MPLPHKGGKAQPLEHHVVSQETGPPSSERKLTVRSFQGEGGRQMFRKGFHRLRFSLRTFIQLIPLIALIAASSSIAQAQSATIHGTVSDPLGNPVAQAKVILLREGHEDTPLANTNSASDGSYSLAAPDTGRYAVRVEATGFDSATSAFVYAGANKSVDLDVSLRVGTLTE